MLLTGIPAYLKILASNETILLKHEYRQGNKNRYSRSGGISIPKGWSLLHSICSISEQTFKCEQYSFRDTRNKLELPIRNNEREQHRFGWHIVTVLPFCCYSDARITKRKLIKCGMPIPSRIDVHALLPSNDVVF